MARAGRMGRRVAGIALGIAGVLVLLVVAAVLLLQSSAVSQRVLAVVVPRASEALGRQVTVQEAKLRLVPGPSVALRGASVAGRPGEPPLAQLDAFEVRLAFWPLLRSLGKDVEVTGIRLVRPVLNLVRDADGTWNYEGLGGGGEQPKPPPSSGPSRTSVVVDHASLEDGAVRLVDHAAGDAAAVALDHIRVTADHVGLGQPLAAQVEAALAADQPNLSARLQLSELPASAAALGPGRYPKMQGELAVNGLDLGRLRALLPASLTRTMTGGRVDVSAHLTTESDGEGERYRVEGTGRLSQVRLRGNPAQGSFALSASADPATGAAEARVTRLQLKGPGVDLGGEATARVPARAQGGPTAVRFALKGPLLDLGQLLAALPPGQDDASKKPFALTAAQRRQVRALDVRGTVELGKVVRGGLTAEDLRAEAVLERGAFVLREAGARLFGGKVDAAGTRLDLAQAQPRWNLKAKLAAVDLGQALQAMAGAAPVVGHLDGALDLTGAGVDWATLQKVLDGTAGLSVKQGALTTTDLGSHVLGAVAKGLRAVGRGGLAGAVGGAAGQTTFRDLVASFTVKDGAMTLSRPLTFQTPSGAVRLGGRIGLSGALALQGTATVPREALRPMVGGVAGLVPAAGLEVPLTLGGTLGKPDVGVHADQAVAGLAKGAAQQKAGEVKGAVEDRVRREARRGLGGVLQGLGVGR